MTRLVIFGAAALALAACSDESAVEGTADDARTAEGEVLGGSISDAMLPLDKVTSQAPALRETPADADDSGNPADDAETGEGSDETEASAEEAPGEAEPAAEEEAG